MGLRRGEWPQMLGYFDVVVSHKAGAEMGWHYSASWQQQLALLALTCMQADDLLQTIHDVHGND